MSDPCTPPAPLTPCPPGSHPEADVAEQVEAPGVHAEVLHDLGVVHVVGEILGDGEVAEAHHLLGGVDDDGAVDAGAALLGELLREQGTAQCWHGGGDGEGRLGLRWWPFVWSPCPQPCPQDPAVAGCVPPPRPLPPIPGCHSADHQQDVRLAGITSNLQSPPMSLVLSKQTGSSPSCRQALMAQSPLLPPPMMATFFAMLPSAAASLPGDSAGEWGRGRWAEPCKTLALHTKEVPS